MYARTSFHCAGGQSTTVTLLLPASLKAELRRHLGITGFSHEVLMRNLVQAFSLHIVKGLPVKGQSPRTRYQAAGLDLERFNLRLSWITWARLQGLGRGLGVSACMLATYLVRLELNQTAGVPTKRLIVPAYNRKVTLRTTISTEMTRPSFSRKLVLRQTHRDAHVAHMMRLVREEQRKWITKAAGPSVFRSKSPPKGR